MKKNIQKKSQNFGSAAPVQTIYMQQDGNITQAPSISNQHIQNIQNVQPQSSLINNSFQAQALRPQMAQIGNNLNIINSNQIPIFNQIPNQQNFVQPQIFAINNSNNLFSASVFGNMQMNQSNNFMDDDEILVEEKISLDDEKSKLYNLHDMLTLKVKSAKSRIKLDPLNDKTVPIHVSFTAENSDFKLNNRSNVDLVCVIDQSGSMGGEKIKLVKESFKFLLELLGDNDRLSVVSFQNNAFRIAKLTKATTENKQKLQELINRISPSGGTNINSGVTMALEILKQRKYKNNQSSIFVLSDGVDNMGKQAKAIISSTLINYEQYESLIGNYTLNTFGYGKDTDSEVLSAIAELKDGTFFFIDKLDMVDECFVDCLGSILTSIGENVNLTVKSLNSEIIPGIKISKALGGKNLWKWNDEKTEFTSKISKLILGKSKDFILELNVPKSSVKLDDIIEIPVVNVVLSAESFSNEQSNKLVEKSLDLKIEFFSDNVDSTEQEIYDPELSYNLYRLVLAETMNKAKGYADQNNYEKAKEVLNSLKDEISNSKYYNSSEKIKLIIEEINIAMKDVSPQVYTVSGSHNMVSNMNCNFNQSSKPMNVQYSLNSNFYQKEMNNHVKMSKKK